MTGDIVVLEKDIPYDQYHIGDAVLYSPPYFDEIIIHRIYDIQTINGSYYFALKGDSNPQPDSVPETGDIQNEILINKTVTWSAFYDNVTNPTAEYIVASYFPADQVVFGKVIFKIPIVGWFFVPFNSPFPEPFRILPISMFSFFTIFYIFIALLSIFLLMHRANLELNRLLHSLTLSPSAYITPVRISIKNFYTLLFYPLILFILIMFTATPTPLTNTDQIILQSSTQKSFGNTSYIELIYLETEIIDSIVVKQHNETTITLLLWNESSLLKANITKDLVASGQNLNDAGSFNESSSVSYQLTIDPKTMIVLSSSINNAPELKRFFDYTIPSQHDNISGLMTKNVYLKAIKDNYNGIDTFSTELNFSFIQDLISVQWNVKAHFSQSTGFLLFLQVQQFESLWGIPETFGLIFLTSGIALLYDRFRKHFQRLFDEKQENILRAQSSNIRRIPVENPSTNRIFEQVDPNMSKFTVEENKGSSEKKEQINDGKKKLSWEEYKKLEEEE